MVEGLRPVFAYSTARMLIEIPGHAGVRASPQFFPTVSLERATACSRHKFAQAFSIARSTSLTGTPRFACGMPQRRMGRRYVFTTVSFPRVVVGGRGAPVVQECCFSQLAHQHFTPLQTTPHILCLPRPNAIPLAPAASLSCFTSSSPVLICSYSLLSRRCWDFRPRAPRQNLLLRRRFS